MKTLSAAEVGQMSVATLFHGLLFAYQKATKEILGSGCEVFLHPTLEILEKISGAGDPQLSTCENLEEAVNAFSNMLHKANVVENLSLTKIEPERYLLKVQGCAWARHIHRQLEPKDVTCPMALVVMAMFKKCIGDKVEETESHYLEDGTETEIKSFHRFLQVSVMNSDESNSEQKMLPIKKLPNHRR